MEYVAPVSGSPTTGDGGYVTGDLSSGTRGSKIYGEAIEHPQREMVNLIVVADIVPDANNLGQVAEAVDAIAVARAQELISDHNTAATTEAAGHMQFATWAEARTGASVSRAITPDQLLLAFPVGTTLTRFSPIVPTGFLECNGATLSKALYPELYAIIGGTFGETETTFNLPDLRGQFFRVWDNGRGVDVGRTLGSFQGHGVQDHQHDGVHVENLNPFGSTGTVSESYLETAPHSTNILYGHASGPMVTGNAETETRPRNVAIMCCIKY